jgi:hypothetical protein
VVSAGSSDASVATVRDGAVVPVGLGRARLRVDYGGLWVAMLTIIEMNSPDSRTSTTAEVAGARTTSISAIARSTGWNAVTIDPTKMDPIRIYSIPLRSIGKRNGRRPERLGTAHPHESLRPGP